VRFWSAETGESLPLIKQHSSTVERIAFSSDGRRVVTASDDHTARIWDAESGTPVGVPLRHEGEVKDAVFSPDGKLVATASSDKTVRLWNSATGEPLAPMRHDGRCRVVFSHDGRRLVIGQLGEGIARV
jgi:WD40 repeat protein